MRNYLIVIFMTICSSYLSAQTDYYDELKSQYDQLRQEEKYDSALVVAKQMNTWALKNETDTSLRYAVSLRYVGNCYNRMLFIDSSLFYYNSSLVTLENQGRKNYMDAANCLNNLGNLYSAIGDNKAAQSYYKEALEIKKKVLGDEHPDFANSLNNLAVLYTDLGDYKTAEPYYKKALEIYKKFLGAEHLDYASCLNNLGVLYEDMGNYKAAEPYFKKSMEIYRNALGEEHTDYAMSLSNLGILYEGMGDYKVAETYYMKASKIQKKAMGEDHPDFANSINNLGNLYFEMGDYEAAEFYYQQALEIYMKTLGEDNPDYVRILNNLGYLNKKMLDYKAAEAFYNQVLNFKLKQLYINFSWLSSGEKQLHWRRENYFYAFVNSFSVEGSDSVPASIELSFKGNLISKSLLLETSRELDQAIAQSSDKEIKVQFTEMKQLRSLYSKLQSEGSTNKEVMSRYKTQADSLDKILVNKLGEYAASKRKFEITWKDIQSNLTSTDAAIEFARYYDDKDSTYNYMALVVRPEYEFPKLVKLGEEKNIRIAASNKDFPNLYDLVWKDMDTLLSGVQTVFYSPVGELNNVSFSALCFQAGDSVLSILAQNRGAVFSNNYEKKQSCNAVLLDKYTLHQLTTTRYLADGTLNKSKPMNLSLALYGGVNYDDIPSIGDTIVKEISNEDYAFQLNLSKEHSRSVSKKKGKRSSSSFGKKMEYLPGTMEEVMNIEGLLTNTNWRLQTKSNKSAGEYEFKKDLDVNAPGVLHIATHGFAFPDDVKKESIILEMSQTSNDKVTEDPMVRCGLMLSGSNISWTGNPQKMIEQTGDDGILTAAEVANLDLANTKLVVLSACETGLGKIEGSEGTFGLKRGFKLAGVEQIIVSLWSVPDKETMELMTLFYSDLTKTLNPVISFFNAQKEMRNKYPTEPEKWAGFVLVR